MAGQALLLSANTAPQEIGDFSIAQVTNPATGSPHAADKLGKDNNFRGFTTFNNTLLVDLDGFEPSTSSMPWKRAPNCATGPRSVQNSV
jgi:hypothetical protein